MTEEETRWTLTIKFFDRQSKRESQESLHFPDRESAVLVDDAIRNEVGRGPGAMVVAESPDGRRVTFQAVSFQRTVLKRFWSSIA